MSTNPTPTEKITQAAILSIAELDLRSTLGNDCFFDTGRMHPVGNDLSQSAVLKRELALFVALLFLGFVVMPVAIYLIGHNLFGEYGGAGYGGFFNMLSGKIRSGDRIAWFLILAPYLGWQTLRLTFYGWRRTKSLPPSHTGDNSRVEPKM